jgi:hypothetical protein
MRAVKKMKDGGPTTTKSKKGVTTKTPVKGFTWSDVNHKGKQGSTTVSLDGTNTLHKGSKGTTQTHNNMGVTQTTHKGKKGTTLVDKDTNTGYKTVMYQSNKTKNTYTKTSRLKKGGSVKAKRK